MSASSQSTASTGPTFKTTYSKLSVRLSKKWNAIDLIEYYDASGKLKKVEERLEWKWYGDNKFLISHKVKMTTKKDGHSTILELTNPKFNQGLKDDMFTQRYLKRTAR